MMKSTRSKAASRMIEVDDSYPTCEETYAELRIYGGDISADEVTQRLGVVPSSVRVKDRVTVNSLGRARTERLNAWFLSTEGVVTSRDLRRHLDRLLDQLAPAEQALLVLQGEPKVEMTVYCVWRLAEGGFGPTLWPEQMERLSALNLECTFSIHLTATEDSH